MLSVMTQRALTATLVARIPIALFFIVRSPLITSKSRRRVTAARTYQHLYVAASFQMLQRISCRFCWRLADEVIE